MNRFTVTLKRAIVQIKDSEAKSDIINLNNKKIGIINLPSFYIDYKLSPFKNAHIWFQYFFYYNNL
jgi:C-terminal processing protease CtpA/Prc